MENRPFTQEMILKYLDDSEDPALADDIGYFRGLSKENEAYFSGIKRIWDASAATKRLQGIDLSRSSASFSARLTTSSLAVKSKLQYGWINSAVAMIIIAAGIWVYLEVTSIHYLVKETNDEIDSVLLSDGSKVILAANSSIEYPEKFDGAERPVSLLKGKAFFSVTKDSTHAFVLTIRNSTIKVLGTSFNVLYSDSAIDLSVKTGKVMFRPNSKNAPSVLTAGDDLSYNYKKNIQTIEDGRKANSSISRELHFVNTPLKQVCEQLSNYYGVDIQLNNDVKRTKKFNANLNDITLEEALILLKETYSIKIKYKGEKVMIKNL